MEKSIFVTSLCCFGLVLAVGAQDEIFDESKISVADSELVSDSSKLGVGLDYNSSSTQFRQNLTGFNSKYVVLSSPMMILNVSAKGIDRSNLDLIPIFLVMNYLKGRSYTEENWKSIGYLFIYPAATVGYKSFLNNFNIGLRFGKYFTVGFARRSNIDEILNLVTADFYFNQHQLGFYHDVEAYESTQKIGFRYFYIY